MEAAQIVEDCKRYTMYSWSAGDAVDPIPFVSAKGVWLEDATGKRYLDWNSQAMSVHIGHSHPHVIAAMKAQLDRLIYSYPGSATEPRARLGKKLATLLPGDLNTSFFTLGGAESNENAVKAARLFTGRHKILARYRSYHGASNLAAQLTGDHRRWPNEPGAPGVVHVMDPQPYCFQFGSTDEERTQQSLAYLDEVIMYEGPQNVAAMIIETVTGTNGVLPPPKGYLAGLHALLQRHGILLICDEVMAGFGRTGKLFAFEHGGIVPDIVTMAKGLTSSYFPLGAMVVTDRIAAHFKKNVFWGGHTYNSHPLGLATALANIEVIENEKLVENAARLESVMRSEMARLEQKHRSVREGRAIGLFGMIDVQRNAKGEPFGAYAGTHPTMTKLGRFFRDNGLFTFMRPTAFTCIPPLCITDSELRHGFEIVDRGLDVVDADFEG